MLKKTGLYSVYLTNFAVEIRDEGDDYLGSARFVCSHRSYSHTLRFAQDLAHRKDIPLRNYSHFETRYEY